jgi:predicted phosphodiesterase
MSIKKIGLMTDIHMPYESPAYDVALNIFKDQEVDGIILGGDVPEFESVSSHAKRPDGAKQIVEELDYTNARMDELEAMFYGIPIDWVEGNHCHRLTRFLANMAPELFGLGLDCPTLFNVHERPYFTWHSYGPGQLARVGESNLYIRHEPLKGGVNHARATALCSNVDIVYGHTHSVSRYTINNRGISGMESVTAYSLPWLGDASQSCFNYRGAVDKWSNGCAVVTYDDETGEYQLDTIIITEDGAFYGGKSYRY